MSEPRFSLQQLREEAQRRSHGYLPLGEWGPKCAGCGEEEFRIDGYCSIECRNYHDEELAGPLLALVDAVEAARWLVAPGVVYEVRGRKALDGPLLDLAALLREKLRPFVFEEPA